jgi:hypothetical protein
MTAAPASLYTKMPCGHEQRYARGDGQCLACYALTQASAIAELHGKIDEQAAEIEQLKGGAK